MRIALIHELRIWSSNKVGSAGVLVIVRPCQVCGPRQRPRTKLTLNDSVDAQELEQEQDALSSMAGTLTMLLPVDGDIVSSRLCQTE